MNNFDSSISLFFNRFSQTSPLFDQVMGFLSRSNIVKGGVLMSIICWLWFRLDDQLEARRKNLLATIFCSFFAIVIARALALTLPFRYRPLHDFALDFIMPVGISSEALVGWSSFPSDHAVLFFALSFGILFASRKLGLFSLLYTTIFIAFPRIYLGLHYTTDILAGAGIGIVIAWIGNLGIFTRIISKKILPLVNQKPHVFYTAFFFVIYQIADLFNGSRDLASTFFKLLKSII